MSILGLQDTRYYSCSHVFYLSSHMHIMYSIYQPHTYDVFYLSVMHIMYSIYWYRYIGCILSNCHMSQCEVYQPMSLADNFADVLALRYCFQTGATKRTYHFPCNIT